jgi:hypothetical protein
MPDGPVSTTQPLATPTEPTPVVVTQPDPLAAEVARAHEAASAFIAEQVAAETPPVERQRGPDGKFLPKEGTKGPGDEGTEGAPPPVKLDGAWMEAAKIVGFREDEIAAFKSDQDLQKEVLWRRQSVMQGAGIDPGEFQAFQQWRQQQQQFGPPPQQQWGAPPPPVDPQTGIPQQPRPPVQPTALADLKLDLNEENIAPELVKPLRDVQQFANQVKATLGAENAQLKQMMVGLYGMIQQSVEAGQRASSEAQQAAEWDNAAKEVPGFVEAMGMPSEIRRVAQTNPNDPRVQNYVAFRAYFEPTYQRYASILGPGAPLQRVMADAFSASPFAGRVTGNAGTNGKNGPQRGSVIRGAQRRGSSAEPPPQGDPMARELERINEVIGAAWGQAGGNPTRG